LRDRRSQAERRILAPYSTANRYEKQEVHHITQSGPFVRRGELRASSALSLEINANAASPLSPTFFLRSWRAIVGGYATVRAVFIKPDTESSRKTNLNANIP